MIKERIEADGLIVIEVEGRLDHELAPGLEVALTNHLDAGRPRLLVDLSGVSFVNSGGLRILVSAWRRAEEMGGRLVLSDLNERVSEVFAMVGFDKLFHIHDDADSALQALRAE